MEWISVEDKLPENDKSVLGFHRSCYVSMVFHAQEGSFREMWGDTDLYITHWMPLPKPPKTENE